MNSLAFHATFLTKSGTIVTRLDLSTLDLEPLSSLALLLPGRSRAQKSVLYRAPPGSTPLWIENSVQDTKTRRSNLSLHVYLRF